MATKKRLIDPDELHHMIEILYQERYVNSYDKTVHDIFNAVRRRINRCSTVDAVEVVHGEWTIIEDDYCGLIGLECSHCEKTWWFDEESPIGEYHFCPGCGEKMDGDGNG